MKCLLLATTLLSSPALALQTPTPGKADPRICTTVYQPNNVLDVTLIAGDSIEIKFGDKEVIGNDGISHVTASDSAHLKPAVAEGSNVLWLKATQKMPRQPILVRTRLENGQPRDYVIQLTALPPAPRDAAPTQLATNGPDTVTEVSPPGPNICYQITYLYPADEAAAKKAAQAVWWAKKQAQAAEVALRQQQQSKDGKNVRYTAQGDASIGPSEVSDDGNTTTLLFPGNLSIPVIYRINPDGSDGDTIGITTEQNGVVKLHETLPAFRLRQGDLVLCIFNKAYDAIGNNPGTGTTSPDVSRDVHQ